MLLIIMLFVIGPACLNSTFPSPLITNVSGTPYNPQSNPVRPSSVPILLYGFPRLLEIAVLEMFHLCN